MRAITLNEWYWEMAMLPPNTCPFSLPEYIERTLNTVEATLREGKKIPTLETKIKGLVTQKSFQRHQLDHETDIVIKKEKSE